MPTDMGAKVRGALKGLGLRPRRATRPGEPPGAVATPERPAPAPLWAIMAAIGAGMLVVFRRKGWLG